MRAIDAKTLTDLLRGAAEAHHKFEAGLGHPDADWAPWYAEKIVAELGDGAPGREQGHRRNTDFTPTGIRIEQPYENDRNADSKALIKDVIAEAFGGVDCYVGHHIGFEIHETRDDSDYSVPQEYPSIDTIYFDHGIAQKLWGARRNEVLTRLACEPTATRDELFSRLYYGRGKN
jgi:hypothetical protein